MKLVKNTQTKSNTQAGGGRRHKGYVRRTRRSRLNHRQFGGQAPLHACNKQNAIGSPASPLSSKNIPPSKQSSGPNNAMPPPEYNAGLYTGAPFAGPWGNIPVEATAAGHTHDALMSANPPPNANVMYSTGGQDRIGNSFSNKPGVFKYNGGLGQSHYNIKCTARQSGGRRNKYRRLRQQKSHKGIAKRRARVSQKSRKGVRVRY